MAATQLVRAALRISAATTALFTFGLVANAADTATVVGAGPGAGAYQMAGALAENVNRLKVGLTMTNRASKGFVANTRMVETGGAQFALTNGIFVFSAQNGSTPFNGAESHEHPRHRSRHDVLVPDGRAQEVRHQDLHGL